jgi:predicted RNA-binding protein YlxR (DUF448 family)
MKRGHVPLRKCRGCSGSFPKSGLLRFTLGPGGPAAGDGPGRGYYVCTKAACLEKVLSGRSLSRLAGRRLSDGDAERLKRALRETHGERR